jgi:ketosteroid isomerase-like protein
MRTLLTFCFGILAGAALATGASARQSLLADDATRDAVVAVKRAIVEGHRTRDVAALRTLYGDDYTAIDARGAVRTKAQLLAAVPTDPEMTAGRYDIIAVRRFGGFAVATGMGHLVYRNPDGTGRNSDYYSFNVFAERDGRWEYVAAFLP